MAQFVSPLSTANLGDGHWMQTTAELDTVSRVASFTESMTSTNKISGFTGGVQLLYYDDNGSYLNNSGTQQNGIGQAPLFSAGHRVVHWNGLAPEGSAQVGLAQFHDPHNRFGGALADIGNALSSFFTDVEGFFSELGDVTANFCQAHPDVCGIVELMLFSAAGSVVVLSI